MTHGVSALSAVELTNWADQVLRKRLENVRGVGAVTLVGGTKREINLYLKPQALEAQGITPEQVGNAVRNETRICPWARCARWRRSVWSRSMRACAGRRISARSSSGARMARRSGWIRSRLVSDGAQEIESLALYNGQRTLAAVGPEGTGREHHRRRRRAGQGGG
jgi:HAE1 family hydrophobic/amphiphilic exporter-1